MKIPRPDTFIRDEKLWNEHLLKNVPALASLWQQEKFGQFETYKILAGLTLQEFIDSEFDPAMIYCPYIPLIKI